MAITQISPTKSSSKNSITYLGSALSAEDRSFDINKIAANSTDQEKEYLRLSGAYALEEEFDKQVKDYQEMIRREATAQARATEQAIDVSEQETRRATAEAQQGLSTGMSAIVSDQISQQAEALKQQQAETLNTTIAEQEQAFIESLRESYTSLLEDTFGEIEDGRFANVLSNVTTTQYAVIGLFDYAAKQLLNLETLDEQTAKDLIASSIISQDSDGVYTLLNAQGLLNYFGYIQDSKNIFGFELTDMGFNLIDSIINSVTFQDPLSGMENEGNPLYEISKQMAIASMGYDEEKFDKLSDAEKQSRIFQYETWLTTCGQDKQLDFFRYSLVGTDFVEYKQYAIPSFDDMIPGTNVGTTTIGGYTFIASGSDPDNSMDKLVTDNPPDSTGDNIRVYYNGEKYRAEVGDELDANITKEILSAYTNAGLAGDSFLFYDNKLYYMGKADDGRYHVREVQNRGETGDGAAWWADLGYTFTTAKEVSELYQVLGLDYTTKYRENSASTRGPGQQTLRIADIPEGIAAGIAKYEPKTPDIEAMKANPVWNKKLAKYEK